MKPKLKRIKIPCEGSDHVVYAGKRRKIRCVVCNRRLLIRTIFCVGGEFVGYRMPPHKKSIKVGRKNV